MVQYVQTMHTKTTEICIKNNEVVKHEVNERTSMMASIIGN